MAVKRRPFAAVAVIAIAAAVALSLLLVAPSGVAPALPLATASPVAAAPSVDPNSLLGIAERFDGDRARQHLAFLADPARGGRFSASPGFDAAADYVAERFKEYGLEPLGGDGTYFQRFPMQLVDLAGPPALERLTAQPKSYAHRVDYTESIGRFAGGGSADGDLVYVGGGIRADYEGTDARGNIVLIAGPGQGDRAQIAVDEGAAAVLVATPSRSATQTKFSYLPRLEQRAIPVLIVHDSVADDLLAESGKRVADLRRAAEERHNDSSKPPVGFNTGTRVRVSLPLTPVHEVQAKNVVGLLRASDPIDARRAVAIGGHLDGVGTDPDGRVFQAANDNASGPAETIEVARVLSENRSSLRRSVVFIAFAGEEQGFLGSQAFLDRTVTTPGRAESIVAFINLDVVGCCGGTITASEDSAPLRDRVKAAAERFGLPFESEPSGGSDHVSFTRRRVPAVMVHWNQLGPLHTLSDTVQTVEPVRLRDLGRVVTLVALELANGGS